MAASVKFLLSLSKMFLCSSRTFHSSLRLSFSCSMGQLPWSDNASSSHWELSCCCRDIMKGLDAAAVNVLIQASLSWKWSTLNIRTAHQRGKCGLILWRYCDILTFFLREGAAAAFESSLWTVGFQPSVCLPPLCGSPGKQHQRCSKMLKNTGSYGFTTVYIHVLTNVHYKFSRIVPCETELKHDTLTVQSFNMVLEFSPLEANTVGQLLTGMNTNQLQTFLTGIKHVFVLLRLGLTRTRTSDQRSLKSPEAASWPPECDTGVLHALSHLPPVWHRRLLLGQIC